MIRDHSLVRGRSKVYPIDQEYDPHRHYTLRPGDPVALADAPGSRGTIIAMGHRLLDGTVQPTVTVFWTAMPAYFARRFSDYHAGIVKSLRDEILEREDAEIMKHLLEGSA